MAGVSDLRESQRVRNEKRLGEGEAVSQSFGSAVCRRGDSWWQRRIRGCRVGGIDVVLSHRPPLWPRRSDLWSGRLTKAFRGSWAEKQDANSYPTQRDEQAMGRRDDGDRGVRKCVEGRSVLPTPPRLGQWTKGPPDRPEGAAWEWRQTVANRPPVILWPLWFDLHWGGQQGGLTPFHLLLWPPNPQGKKSSSSTCPGLTWWRFHWSVLLN